MRYKIGEISRLLGIPSHVIRFYERRGLVDPEKDYANNYRSYEEFDLLKLLQCRHYRGFGFSLADSVELVNEASSAQLSARLEMRRKDLDEEISRLSEARASLDLSIENSKSFDAELGETRFRDKPPFLWLYSHNEHREPCRDDQIARATERLMEEGVQPRLRFMCLIEREALAGSGPLCYAWGLGIREEEAVCFPKESAKLFRRIEGGRYLCCLVSNDKECRISREQFAPLVARVSAEALAARGPAVAEILAVAHEGGAVVSRLELSMPV